VAQKRALRVKIRQIAKRAPGPEAARAVSLPRRKKRRLRMMTRKRVIWMRIFMGF
jgi:hypothetical protein